MKPMKARAVKVYLNSRWSEMKVNLKVVSIYLTGIDILRLGQNSGK